MNERCLPSLSAAQIRAARALLDWSQDDLADASGLSVATIRKIESGHLSPRGKTSQSIRQAFEASGLEFQDNGLRLKPDDITVYRGENGAKDFFDDVYYSASKKGTEIFLVYPSAHEYCTKVLGDYTELHATRMAAVKKDRPFAKIIVTDDDGPLWAAAYSEYRRISKNYVASVPFYVYDDKYAIITTKADPSPKITVIHSREVAEAFRAQFYSMWEKATPLDAVEKIRDNVARKKARG